MEEERPVCAIVYSACTLTLFTLITRAHPYLQEKKKGPGRDISRLLNRLLGVHVDKQRNIFSYFMLLLVRLVWGGRQFLTSSGSLSAAPLVPSAHLQVRDRGTHQCGRRPHPFPSLAEAQQTQAPPVAKALSKGGSNHGGYGLSSATDPHLPSNPCRRRTSRRRSAPASTASKASSSPPATPLTSSEKR